MDAVKLLDMSVTSERRMLPLQCLLYRQLQNSHIRASRPKCQLGSGYRVWPRPPKGCLAFCGWKIASDGSVTWSWRFSHCAHKISKDIPLSASLDSFKRNLKTQHFANSWPPGDSLQHVWFDVLDLVCSTNSYEWMNEWLADQRVRSEPPEYH